MPSLRERKNPSGGTKVTPGRDAPVHREAAGLVASESLAAESVQQGGEFAQNRNAQPEAISSSDPKCQSGRESGGFAGEAPGYVADQYITDTKGPHGRKVKEGIEDEAGVKYDDGLEKALRSEPGSEDDPSRLAERQLLQRQSLRDRRSGPRQSHLMGETIYDALDREVSSWLRQLFDRFHSRVFTFRDGHHPEDKSGHIKASYSRHHASMSTVPEEKSSLRLPRPPELDSRQQSRTQASTTEGGRRDVPRSTDVPSEEDIHAQEMEHQRYGEAQPQLVPTDMIETMITAKGRKTDSLGGA